MICPNCGNLHSPKKVIKTWSIKNGEVRRKRKCLKCKTVYRTIERIEQPGTQALVNTGLA